MRNVKMPIAFIVFVLLISCKKETITVLQSDSFRFEVPSHFPQPHYQSLLNPVSKDGFELGRRLFYDKRLSEDNSVSCASCHHQQFAFSDAGQSLSEGVYGRLGFRNSPAMYNLAWMPDFMWDGGVNHIEIMPFAPLTDSVEMNMDMKALLHKLETMPEYPTLFQKAFGSPEINDQRLFYALTQFMVMLVSSNSKYDWYVTGKGNLTQHELSGKQLFEQHCARCHEGILFTNYGYFNNGLDASPEDIGRERITQNPMDKGKFKVPSLRNVALTAPYMHDGRFSSLDEVIDHYRFGIKQSVSLDAGLENGISLTDSEKSALIIFLETLSDEKLISDQRFSSPF